MTKLVLKEMVETVLNNHPKDCIFTPNALELILKELESLNVNSTLSELVTVMTAAIERQEIYCPHEGIDRRAEFNVEATSSPLSSKVSR